MFKKKRNKEDLYISVLKFGKANIGRPFKYIELQKYLNKKGYKYEEFALRQFFAALFVSRDSPSGNDTGRPINDNYDFFLEHSGYFNLMEHEELNSARKSSLVAKCFAIIAIIISIISTYTSIYFSNRQLNTPSTISPNQFEQIKNTNIKAELNEIIVNQKLILEKIKNETK